MKRLLLVFSLMFVVVTTFAQDPKCKRAPSGIKIIVTPPSNDDQ